MANIPIREIALTGTPDSSSLIVFDNGQMRKATVGSMADAVRPLASQAEALAGADNTKTMTPLRVKEAVESRIGSTPAAARVLLGIDKRTSVGDANYSILATDVVVATTAAFTAPRTWSLPLAASCNPGQRIYVIDEVGAVSGSNTLTVARSGSDTVVGVASILLTTPRDGQWFETDGSSKWSLAVPNSRFVNTRYSPTAAGTNVSGAANRTVHDKLYERVSVLDFQAKGDNSTDNAQAFADLAAHAVGKNLRIYMPAGRYLTSAAWVFDGNSNIEIAGDGTDISVIEFTGSTGGITSGTIGSGWANVLAAGTQGVRPFFGAHDLSLLCRGAGLYNAITLYQPYSGSTDLCGFNFYNLNIGPRDWSNSAQYWQHGIYVYNAWRGSIINCTVNQSINKMSGSAFFLDGLSPAVHIDACVAQYWNIGTNIGWVNFTAFNGSVLTGTFQYAEEVVGGTSGARARVARTGAFGSASLVCIGTSGIFANGETITGTTSGATLTNITKPTITQGNEGIYLNNSEIILNNYGFYCNQPSGATTPAIGMWVQNSNIVSAICSIYGRYTGQWIISGCLIYNTANGCTDIDIDGGDIASIQDNQIHAGSYTTTTGIKVGASLGYSQVVISGNTVGNRTTGIVLGAALINSPYPALNNFFSNGTNLTTPAPANFSGPSTFSAHNNGTSQTGIVPSTGTQLVLGTALYNVGGNYNTANSRWTPPPGPVSLIAGALFTTNVAATDNAVLAIYKNGSDFRHGAIAYAVSAGVAEAAIAIQDIANGTDYYEVWCFVGPSAGNKATQGNPTFNYFMGLSR